jgi:2'-5' RNA ligase
MQPEQPSPQGRRILLAIVTGEAGARIQRWRETHDSEQARRYPPHATLCYWVPEDSSGLDAQVTHAFPAPVTVGLGGPRLFDNPDRTLYVDVQRHHALDEARMRLFDGTHLSLSGRNEWTWHVTCLRRTAERTDEDVAELLASARRDLTLDCEWVVDEVAHLVLDDDRYRRVRTWYIGGEPASVAR